MRQGDDIILFLGILAAVWSREGPAWEQEPARKLPQAGSGGGWAGVGSVEEKGGVELPNLYLGSCLPSFFLFFPSSSFFSCLPPCFLPFLIFLSLHLPFFLFTFLSLFLRKGLKIKLRMA